MTDDTGPPDRRPFRRTGAPSTSPTDDEDAVPDNLLGEFLRARRRALRQDILGLATDPHRRAPGLRRDEVARRAGVSVGYYKRLEQGRDSNPSRQVLASIARALALAPPESAHLSRLAGFLPPPEDEQHVRRVVQELSAFVGGMSHVPALLLSPGQRVLVVTPPVRALLPALRPGRNLIVDHFRRPTSQRVGGWEVTAADLVAHTRVVLAERPRDAELNAVVDDLRRDDPVFAQLWGRHDVTTAPTLRLAGSEATRLLRLAVPQAPGFTVLVAVSGAESLHSH